MREESAKRILPVGKRGTMFLSSNWGPIFNGDLRDSCGGKPGNKKAKIGGDGASFFLMLARWVVLF